MPFISVIVPAYRAEHTIEKCVGSLLSQTFTDIEVIVVDDGSPDATLSILQRMAAQDQRLVVVHQDNAGVSAARNRGLTVARAPWVAFVDSDDYVTDDYIEKLLPDNDDTDFTVCSYFNEYPDGRRTASHPIYDAPLADTAKLSITISELMTRVNAYHLCGPCCKLFKRSLLLSQSVTFPVGMSFGEDAVFVFSYLQHVEKVQVSLRATYCYTHTGGESLSQSATSVQWADMGKKIFRLMAAICDRHHVADRRRVERHLLDRLTTALALNRHDHCMTRQERHECYDMIAQNVSYSNYRKSLPMFFPVFAVLRWWRGYEWLCEKIYR